MYYKVIAHISRGEYYTEEYFVNAVDEDAAMDEAENYFNEIMQDHDEIEELDVDIISKDEFMNTI